MDGDEVLEKVLAGVLIALLTKLLTWLSTEYPKPKGNGENG